jgi:HSP20 family protein
LSSFNDDWFKRFREGHGFFFPDIERMIEEMERKMTESIKAMEDTVPRDMVRSRRLPDGSMKREYGPFVYGYSVKIGPDGKPIIKEFGNIKPGPGSEGGPPLNLQDSREPLVDVIEEVDEVKVTAELPGVDKKDIHLLTTERTMKIDVNTPELKYHKELELPVEVEESSAKSTYRNGVLETVFRKRSRRRGRQIKIE